MSNSTRPLTGSVASVLNAREVAINIGSDGGVEVGMRFAILAPTPTEIRDPSSGDLLGTVDREKTRVKIVSVDKRFSVGKTYRKTIFPATGIYRTVFGGGAVLGSPERTTVETLRADDAALPPPLPEEESYVKTGDRVVQLLRDEDEPVIAER